MNVMLGNISIVTGDWIAYDTINNFNDTYTYKFHIGSYKFTATFSMWAKFGILVFDGNVYKIVDTATDLANAMQVYQQMQELYKAVALIKLQQ